VDIIAFAGCAVVISLLVLVLRQQKPELGQAAAVAAGVLMLGVIMLEMKPVLTQIRDLIAQTTAGDYVPVVLKALGICMVTQLAADICRDSGQQTVATNMEIAGRLAMLAVSLPLLSSVLSAAVGIIR